MLNTFETVILALALALNLMPVCFVAGHTLRNNTLWEKGWFAGIMFLVTAVMMGAGLWLGYKIGGLAIQSNAMISVGLLLVFGIKILLSAVSIRPEEKAFDFLDKKVILFTALGEGITPFSVAIAMGLITGQPFRYWLVSIAVIAAGILAGVVLGHKMGLQSFRLRFGPVGGLLIIAVAGKLILSLVGSSY